MDTDMSYGKYEISVSIGYGASRTSTYDVTEDYDEEGWYALSEDERQEIVHDAAMDIMGQYVDYGYSYKD